MNAEKDITEYDMFNFVFAPEKLNEDIKSVIRQNDRLRNTIGFYKELKKAISEDIDSEVKAKLAERIRVYSNPKIFRLQVNPLPDPMNNRANDSLAAKSGNDTSPTVAQTFLDSEKNYAVRIINTQDITKIYLFDLRKSGHKNIRVRLLPGETEILLNEEFYSELPGRIITESVEVILE